MKCVCGYEHQDGIDENGDWNDYIKGDEKFIKSKSFLIIEESFYQKSTKPIYACPKCGSLKIDV